MLNWLLKCIFSYIISKINFFEQFLIKKKHLWFFKIIHVFSVYVCTFAKVVIHKGRLFIFLKREKGTVPNLVLKANRHDAWPGSSLEPWDPPVQPHKKSCLSVPATTEYPGWSISQLLPSGRLWREHKMWILSSVGPRLNLITWKHWCYARIPTARSGRIHSSLTLLYCFTFSKSWEAKNIWERRLLAALVANIPSSRIWVFVCGFVVVVSSLMSTACTVPYSFCNAKLRRKWFVWQRQSGSSYSLRKLSTISVSRPYPEFCFLSLNKVVFLLLLISKKYCMKTIFKNNI